MLIKILKLNTVKLIKHSKQGKKKNTELRKEQGTIFNDVAEICVKQRKTAIAKQMLLSQA